MNSWKIPVAFGNQFLAIGNYISLNTATLEHYGGVYLYSCSFSSTTGVICGTTTATAFTPTATTGTASSAELGSAMTAYGQYIIAGAVSDGASTTGCTYS